MQVAERSELDYMYYSITVIRNITNNTTNNHTLPVCGMAYIRPAHQIPFIIPIFSFYSLFDHQFPQFPLKDGRTAHIIFYCDSELKHFISQLTLKYV